MTSKLFDLSGKCALITGGNSGIGLAYARGLAKQGADIIIWGRNESKNKQAADEIESLGVKAFSQVVDVSQESSVIEGFEVAAENVGRIDCVIQNAGFNNPAASFMELSYADWRAQMSVALDGGFFTLREASKHMVGLVKQGGQPGNMILCGSGVMFGGIQGLEHYAAAKAGLAAMMRCLSTELAPYGIRVNMIAPGYVETSLAIEPEVKKAFIAKTPIGRLGRVSDLEGAAAYLASDQAAFHTGDILSIDGGWRSSYV